jgi:hypothetical protein
MRVILSDAPGEHGNRCVRHSVHYGSLFRLTTYAWNSSPAIGPKAQEVGLEVPRKLIEDWKRENPERELTDQGIAADIARVVVQDAISSLPDLPAYN